MNKRLTNYIDKRIDKSYYKLREDTEWKKANEEYQRSYENFHNKLHREQKKELDNIIDLKNSLMRYETIFGYKVGATDIIKLFKS